MTIVRQYLPDRGALMSNNEASQPPSSREASSGSGGRRALAIASGSVQIVHLQDRLGMVVSYCSVQLFTQVEHATVKVRKLRPMRSGRGFKTDALWEDPSLKKLKQAVRRPPQRHVFTSDGGFYLIFSI